MTFRSPLEHDPQGPVPQGDSSHEVWFPPSAKQSESTSLGFTSPDTFRLQVFSTSWRFAPQTARRPYCMPLALTGFCPSERSPQRQHRALVESGSLFHSRCWHHLPMPACWQMKAGSCESEDPRDPAHAPWKRCWSAFESVHVPIGEYPKETADALMGISCLLGDMISRPCSEEPSSHTL